jgi:hypothetical protein
MTLSYRLSAIGYRLSASLSAQRGYRLTATAIGLSGQLSAKGLSAQLLAIGSAIGSAISSRGLCRAVAIAALSGRPGGLTGVGHALVKAGEHRANGTEFRGQILIGRAELTTAIKRVDDVLQLVRRAKGDLQMPRKLAVGVQAAALSDVQWDRIRGAAGLIPEPALFLVRQLRQDRPDSVGNRRCTLPHDEFAVVSHVWPR